MLRLKLTLAYEGTRYAGWQLQSPGVEARCPTVQGVLERAVASLTGCRVPVHGAGRTDAGVHAEAQVCHLDLPESAGRIHWLKALNIKLPSDIRVSAAEWVETSFHARKSARGKRYAYALWMHTNKALPRIANFVWSCPPLDTSRLQIALPLLVGTKDFASFQNSGTPRAGTVRTLGSIAYCPGLVGGMQCPSDWPVGSLIFEGNGFLKQMVRNLVGLVSWVAMGKLEPETIPDILAARARKALPSPSAPAQGLTLLEVLY